MTDTTNPHELFDSEASGEAFRVMAKLSDAGFVAYLAGGCVRDALLGRPPKDFDVATNATPESVRDVFGRKRTLAFGASFGVIGVLPEKSSKQSNAVLPTEVATFRSDGDYSDGRRPDSVQYGSAEEDALRRDFTINGMFYDPVAAKVIDYVGGQDDLQSGVLRTIGNASHRIDEDKLRMLRAVRFATTLGFAIHDDTRNAIRDHASEIAVVSGERIGAEMRKILKSENVAEGLRKLFDCDLNQPIIPELKEDQLQSISKYLDALPSKTVESSLAAILVGAELDAKSLRSLTKRWKLANEEARQIDASLKHWKTITSADSLPWSVVQPVLIDRDAAVIVDVAQAAAVANSIPDAGVTIARDALGWETQRLNPKPLLTGDDLTSSGIAAGPVFKEILSTVRNAQLDNKITTQDQAFAIANEILERDG